jgi:DNA-binding NtrC family response regulator
MQASLVAIAGPNSGEVVRLGPRLSIGRSRTSGLCVPDAALSRHHCAVSNEADRVVLKDLESLNGTFVNGIPVRERLLRHGDQIKLGHSLFVFLTGDIPAESAPSALVAPDEATVASTVGLAAELLGAANGAGVAGPHSSGPRLPNLQHDMVGESERMRQVYEVIARVAATESTVLLHGESGTGKELAAQAIHRNSPRAEKPFVSINCAALTDTLLESDLFGHEKGAFTGAIAQKRGKLEVADGGTVFFDEIGDLAQGLQAKLLRALQQREVERVGGTRPIKVNIRVIAATNKNLEEAVRKGSFRDDLYYRLHVVTLTMPPLRDRKEDVPLLAAYFVAKYAERCNRRVFGLSAEARAQLLEHDWPGNVRELENTIERAIVLGNTDRILPEDLPEAVLEAEAAGGLTSGYHAALREAKRKIVLQAIEQAGGRYSDAARALGLHPNNLHRLARTLSLRDESSRAGSRAHRRAD